MLELEPFTWKKILQEELDQASLQSFLSILSAYLEYEEQSSNQTEEHSYNNVTTDASEGFEAVVFERLQIERPRLEHVLRVRRALFFWLLPAVSLAGALAHILLLLYWRYRLVCREATGLPVGVGDRRSTHRTSLDSTPTRLSPGSAFGPGLTRSFSTQPNNMEFDRGHMLTPSSQQSVIHSGVCESPSCGHESELSPQRPAPMKEKSACALHLELYAISCIALFSLTSVESVCVYQFQTHPSLMHSALCRLWPLIYHLVFTFPPAILIFPLFRKISLLRSLKNLGNYYRTMHAQSQGRQQFVETAMIAIAEQSAAALTRHHVRFQAELAETRNEIVPDHSVLLRPTSFVCGKLCAGLCAFLLSLSAVHTVWIHTLISNDGRPECGVSASVGLFFLWVWPRVQLFLSSLAPAFALLSISAHLLVCKIHLHVRHRRQMIYIMMGPSVCATPTVPFTRFGPEPQIVEMRDQQQQLLERERLADAQRECLELAHLIPTALAVALSRVLYLSLLLFYAHDPISVALNQPQIAFGTSGNSSASSVESSSINLTHARNLSLSLLVAQIVLLATHAVALPLAALSLPLVRCTRALINLCCCLCTRSRDS